MTEFIDKVKRIHDHHHFKITNSYGCRQYYRYYKCKRKSKLPEATFRKILIDIIQQIIDDFLMNYLRVSLPHKMGELYIKQFELNVYKAPDGKYKKRTPVHWGNTLKLWESDPEAYANKTLVKASHPHYHTLMYETHYGSFHNRRMFQLRTCRELNKRIFKQLTNNNNFRLWQSNTPL